MPYMLTHIYIHCNEAKLEDIHQAFIKLPSVARRSEDPVVSPVEMLLQYASHVLHSVNYFTPCALINKA